MSAASTDGCRDVTAPNLFVIGAPRCGTTSLFAALKQHPDVYTSVLKEPHHYAKDLPAQPHTVTDEDDYRRFFRLAGEQTYRAEGSVWYLYSTLAPELIGRAHPDARIVVMLRDPVQMLISLHGLYLRTGNESEPNPDIALMRSGEAEYPGTYFPFGLYYRRLLDFVRPLQRWRAQVPPARLKVIFYEDFYADPDEGFRELCRWLEIHDAVEVSFDPVLARERVRLEAMRQIRDLPDALRRKMNPGAGKHHAGRADTAVSAQVLASLRLAAQEANATLPILVGRALPSRWLGL